MSRPALCFSIKVVPDYDRAARANDLPDAAAAQSFFGRESLPPPFHKIVSISALTATYHLRKWSVIEMASLHIGDRSEKDLIALFLRLIQCTMPTLISFGGIPVLPILRSRAQLYRLSAPHLAHFAYFDPSDMHLDLREKFAPKAGRSMSLDALCRAQGVGEKVEDMDDSKVETLVAAAKFDEIALHGISDVIATYSLFLVQEVFAGRLNDATAKESYDSLLAAYERMEATKPTKFVQT